MGPSAGPVAVPGADTWVEAPRFDGTDRVPSRLYVLFFCLPGGRGGGTEVGAEVGENARDGGSVSGVRRRAGGGRSENGVAGGGDFLDAEGLEGVQRGEGRKHAVFAPIGK